MRRNDSFHDELLGIYIAIENFKRSDFKEWYTYLTEFKNRFADSMKVD